MTDDPYAEMAAATWDEYQREKERIDSLDAAWAEAEAALPEGWTLTLSRTTWSAGVLFGARAKADFEDFDHVPAERCTADTPAAALRALAARLREREG